MKSSIDEMREHIKSGKKIIVASEGPPAGTSDRELIGMVLDTPDGYKIRVLRRATRQEYLDNAPDRLKKAALKHVSPATSKWSRYDLY